MSLSVTFMSLCVNGFSFNKRASAGREASKLYQGMAETGGWVNLTGSWGVQASFRFQGIEMD